MFSVNSFKSINLSNLKISIYLILLLFGLFCRGISLEYGELVDPTETRYATISANMVLTNDWITPRLPTENGWELYISKPPMHFWLTAAAYKLFGIEEWTSRLPSFLALVSIIIAIMVYAKNFFNKEIGYIASIITITSPLMFILAGSSTIDVTFAAFTFIALVAFAVAVKKTESLISAFIPILLFFSCTAFAFLTKGPLALILIGIPFFAFCIFKRSIPKFKILYLLSGLLIFLLITVPWFYLLENENPGSVWYYFYNENFLRYLKKEYGGKHGDAHIQPYGMIWLMLSLNMLPWSLYLICEFIKRIKNYKTINLRNMNPWIFYALICGLSSMIFFTIGRSTLPAYIIPGIPGLALCIAYLLNRKSSLNPDVRGRSILCYNWHLPAVAPVGLFLVLLLVIGLFVAKPIVERKKSAANIIKIVAEGTKEAAPIIAVTSTNNYSPYWMSQAYQEELANQITVKFANKAEVLNGKYKNLIIREKRRAKIPVNHNPKYQWMASSGYWHWYQLRTN